MFEYKNHIKEIVLIGVLSIAGLHANSQSFQMPERYTGKKHRGFFLSYTPLVNYTSVSVDSKNYGYSTFKGTGLGMDLKIGGAIIEDLILHASIFGHGVIGPKIDSDDWQINNVKTDNKVSLTEIFLGPGLTYYNSYNYLFSASLGIGFFALKNEREDINYSTDAGFSIQLKAGKEWWVSPNWAMGVAAYYHGTNCLNQEGNDAEERIKSNNFGIAFCLTRNGRK